MTNTVSHIESLASDLGFKADPGFSGHLALYNDDGTGVLVLVIEDDELRLQLYRRDAPGAELELLRNEEISLRAEWGDYARHRATRRINDLVFVLPRVDLV